jgi:hypothetical protein
MEGEKKKKASQPGWQAICYSNHEKGVTSNAWIDHMIKLKE